MLYTRFREIDDTLGGIENGELAMVSADLTTKDYIFKYILYSLAKQITKRNRQNIKNYDKKIKDIFSGENIEFEEPIEKVLVLGNSKMDFKILSSFPRCEYEEKEKINYAKRLMVLFNKLAIENMSYYCRRCSSDLLIKDITTNNNYDDIYIKSHISVICVYDTEITSTLKEVAQKLNIPIFIFTDLPYKDIIRHHKKYIDKLIIIKHHTECEGVENKETTCFHCYNFKNNKDYISISNYLSECSPLIYNGTAKYNIKHREYENQFLITYNIKENREIQWDKIIQPSRWDNKECWYDDGWNDKVFWNEEKGKQLQYEKDKAIKENTLNLFLKIYKLNKKSKNIYCYSPRLMLEYPLLSCIFNFTRGLQIKELDKKIMNKFPVNEIIIFTKYKINKIRELFTDGLITKIRKLKNNENLMLAQMARNSNYLNKNNFSQYLHLSREKNEQFWACIKVFQRIQFEDLYELLAEYKKDADEQELLFATVILRNLLIKSHKIIDNKFELLIQISE